MSTRDDLIAAKALIDTPEKWIKGSYSNFSEDCFCAWGAAVRHHALTGSAEFPMLNALSLAVPQAFRGWHKPGHAGRIIEFNDDPATTHADIMALFDRAIAAAESAS